MAKGGGIKAGGGGGGGGAAAAAPSGNGATFDALKKFEQKNGEGGLHNMESARNESPLKGAAFDSEMLRLYNSDKIILHNHDYIANVEPAKLKTFIKDSYGNYFHAWAIRPGN